MNSKLSASSGFVLVEALVAIAILSVVVAFGMSALLVSIRSSLGNGTQMQATFLAEEGLEAARVMRDDGWSTIASHASGTPFFIGFTGSTWQATSSNASIDNLFARTITVYDVYRDSNQDIVSSGGTIDNDTKKITVTVSWRSSSGTTTRSLSTYLTNVFNN